MADKEIGRQRFAMAMGGKKVEEDSELELDGNIVTFVASVEKLEGFDIVVAVGHRKHPLTASRSRREHELLALLPQLRHAPSTDAGQT